MSYASYRYVDISIANLHIHRVKKEWKSQSFAMHGMKCTKYACEINCYFFSVSSVTYMHCAFNIPSCSACYSAWLPLCILTTVINNFMISLKGFLIIDTNCYQFRGYASQCIPFYSSLPSTVIASSTSSVLLPTISTSTKL